jgi:hypothetical protein
MGFSSTWNPHKARGALVIPLVSAACWAVPLAVFLIVQ